MYRLLHFIAGGTYRKYRDTFPL